MSDGTQISWSDATWPVTTGCEAVSPGCDHCYAARLTSGRLRRLPEYAGLAVGGVFTGEIRCHPHRLDWPLGWRKPRRIFVASMSDLFHDDVPDGFIADVWRTMAFAGQHVYQVLTKRPARMRSLLTSESFRDQAARAYPWPLPNVWCGVSVETQQWADIRIPALLDTPAAVRWVSAEPLLGPLNLFDVPDGECSQAGPAITHEGLVTQTDYGTGVEYDCEHQPALDWVVAGGESGPGARPAHPDWMRSLRDQCTATGVAYHLKQWGEWVEPDQIDTAGYDDVAYDESGLTVWPDGRTSPHHSGELGAARVRRVGKRHAGRLLDGRTHDDYPVCADGGA